MSALSASLLQRVIAQMRRDGTLSDATRIELSVREALAIVAAMEGVEDADHQGLAGGHGALQAEHARRTLDAAIAAVREDLSVRMAAGKGQARALFLAVALLPVIGVMCRAGSNIPFLSDAFVEGVSGAIAALDRVQRAAQEQALGLAPDCAGIGKLGLDIAKMGMPTRTRNALKGAGIESVEDLVMTPREDLLRISGVGRKGVADIEEALRVRGLRLALRSMRPSAAFEPCEPAARASHAAQDREWA